ncbi:class I SAM-dependent methyltransferase [Catenovulum sp. SX2]|uniref:class I SAM-dependent methyltransferase n=1 Tax=Catenovulum sp. SX2 TaxID=3398614 RepID=UPI003F85A1CF
MQSQAKFWDKIANRYAKRPIADLASYQHKCAVTQSYFTLDMQVLEIGCGSGTTALEHAPFVGNYLAIDIAQNMLDIANEKLAQREDLPHLTFAQGSLENYQQQKFDAILALNVLHILPNAEATVQLASTMLKPGGLFITSTTCLKGHINCFKFLAPIGQFFNLMPNVNMFSFAELEKMHLNAGFELEYIWQSPNNTTNYFLVARKLTN